MLKINKSGRIAKKFVQLKLFRNFGEKCDPCRKSCPPSYACKQPKIDPDYENWLKEFDEGHPFLECRKAKDYKTYKNMTLFFCLPLLLTLYYSITYMAQPVKRPKFIKYEFMRLRYRTLPWRDGVKSLFHNPYYNALPDGYEFEVPEDEEFDPRITDCPQK